MLEFLQANWASILVALAFLYMLFMHSSRGHGMSGGCGIRHEPRTADESHPSSTSATPGAEDRPGCH